MLDSAGQGVIILTKSAALYFVLMGLSAPLGHVSLASERAETPKARKEGLFEVPVFFGECMEACESL